MGASFSTSTGFKLRHSSWPIIAGAILLAQTVVSLTVGESRGWISVINFIPLALVLLASVVALLNAERSTQGVRLFWAFMAAAFALWALNPAVWIYAMVIRGRAQDPIWLTTFFLFLHTVPLIAAVASSPHLKSSIQKPYRVTLNFSLLLLSWVFVYAYVMYPYRYAARSDVIVHFAGFYFAENLLLLAILGRLVFRTEAPWKTIYLHLFGASALYAVVSLAGNLRYAWSGATAGPIHIPYLAAACWFVWVTLLGGKLALQLVPAVRPDERLAKYSSVLAWLAVTAVPLVGVWELLRPGELLETRVARLLIVLASSALLAVVLFLRESLASRELSTDAVLASERLRLAMESGKTVAWDYDVKRDQNNWSGDLHTMFGLAQDTFVSNQRDFRDRIHPDDRDMVSQAVDTARRNHEPYRAQFRVLWPDGTVRWVAASGKFYYAANGEPLRMLGIAQDITDRKQIEEKLLESQERLTGIVVSALDAIIAVDQEQRIVVFNKAAEKMFGCQAAEAIGSPLERFIPQRFWGAHREHIRDFGETGKSSRSMGALGPLWALRANGEEFPFEASISQVDAGDKKLFTVIMRDVTEHRRAEEARFRHAAIVESSDDAIISKNLEGLIMGWNAGAQRIFGFSEEEVVGKPITIIIPPDLWDEEAEILRRLHGGKRIEHYETVRVTKEGKRVNVSLTIAPVRDLAGRIAGFSKIARDITESKRAESALRESEERFRLLANDAPVMIWMAGTDKLCNYFNRTWLEFTGRPLAMELGNGWAEGVHPEDFDRCLATYVQRFDKRENFSMEYRLRRHDGEYRWVLDTGVPRFTTDGSFAGYIGSCVDVTDHKLAEEALSGLSRKLMEAHEEERTWIARELHDDVGQRMALLTIELERLGQVPPSAAAEIRSRVQELCKRVMDMGKDISAISHRLHSSKLEYLGITAAAAGFCKELAEQHEVEIDLSSEGIPEGLPYEIALCLFRVLQEALHNAVKYAGVRHFTVALRGAGDAVELEVIDTGVGFDPEAAMRSHGLGLISMQERLSLVKGEISIESKSGVGTRVRARVPFCSSGDYLVEAVG
ncbi:MAG TPA: PAS domain S-box protein [Candidatus Angelobacter sp.]